jgi:hypothetical protein
LQAEAVAREWAPAGNTNELFLAGIKASFDAYEIPEADYTTYITTSPAAQLPADMARHDQSDHHTKVLCNER